MNLNLREKFELLRLGLADRKRFGYRSEMGAYERALKAQIYADIIGRHPNYRRHLPKIVNAVNSLLKQPPYIHTI